MADYPVVALDETTPQLIVPLVGDGYSLPRPVNIAGAVTHVGDYTQTGNFSVSGTINGYTLSDMLQSSDLASQGEAEAGSDNTKWMSPLRVAQAIAVLAAGIQNKLDGVVAPTNTNDETEGYSAGSFWIDTVNNEAYRCVDPTTNLAVWVNTTLTTSELAAVALSGDSDDLTEGATKLLLTTAERSKLAAIEANAILTKQK